MFSPLNPMEPTNKYLPPRENRTNFNEKILESIIDDSKEVGINFEKWSEKINNET